jgi:hypothetical protein
VQIVDAPIAVVAAWKMDKTNREHLKGHVALGGLDRDVLAINDHHDIYHVVFDVSFPGFLPRQFVSRNVWKWGADKTELTAVGDNAVHGDFPERKEYLRASGTGMFKYQQEAEVGEIPQTKVTWTQQLDFGGAIPKGVQNRRGVSIMMYEFEQPSTSPTPTY